MKYKIISFLSLIIVFVLCLIANAQINKTDKSRVDQHLDSKIEDNCKETDDFCTHLPIVSIDTNNQEIPGLNGEEEMITVNFSLYNNEDVSNRLTDKEQLKNKVQIRYRGNSSLSFDKHQYLLKFVNNNLEEKAVSLLGMNEENKWILNGPYLDKTLIRNYLAYNISGKIMEHVPEVRYCEVFLDGKYQGVYLLIESVSRTLTEVTRYKPNWSNGMSSYIIRLDRADDKNVMLNNLSKYTGKVVSGNAINIVYPSEKDLKDNIVEYINEDFSKFEKALYSYDYKEYEKYIDVDSFVDYMLINEFFKNSDAGTHSTYLYKDVRGKLHMGPVWDFNNSANNYVEEVYGPTNFLFQDKTWYDMLLKDEEFVNKIIKRYRELRKSYLSDAYIQNYIDSTNNYLGSAIDRNFEVWGYTFTEESIPDMLRPSNRNYTSYEEALKQLKTFLKKRGEWLDENIESLKQYSHPSVNKVYEGD